MVSNAIHPIWNKADLPLPPSVYFQLICNDPVSRASDLCHVLDGVLLGLNEYSAIHSEGAILSRFIHRLKKSFRLDKGIKAVQKVHQALKCFLSMELAVSCNILRRSISGSEGPSRQMLQYLLVRLQGFAKLFVRVYYTCLEAAHFLGQRFRSGHSWNTALAALAIVSRIWTISQFFLKSSFQWYSDLKPFLDDLKLHSIRWLPEGYQFPADLKAWIGVDFTADNMKMQLEIPDEVIVQTWKTNCIISKEESEHKKDKTWIGLAYTTVTPTSQKKLVNFVEDFGEVISRDSSIMQVNKKIGSGVYNKEKINKAVKKSPKKMDKKSLPVSIESIFQFHNHVESGAKKQVSFNIFQRGHEYNTTQLSSTKLQSKIKLSGKIRSEGEKGGVSVRRGVRKTRSLFAGSVRSTKFYNDQIP